jgi:hypothetical protein
MKIAWNLVLPDLDLEKKLKVRLTVVQKPFICATLIMATLLIVGTQMNSYINKRYKNPD